MKVPINPYRPIVDREFIIEQAENRNMSVWEFLKALVEEDDESKDGEMTSTDLIYKCVKETVVHRGRKENPFPSCRGEKDYRFVVGKTYHVTKKETFDGSGVYTYLIKHPEKDLIIAPLFLNSFFSKIEEKK